LASAARATRDDLWLARAIQRYNRLCADPALGGGDVAAAFATAQARQHLTFSGRVLCRSLRPAFISPQALEELRAAVRAFWSVITIVERRALTDPALAAELGLSETERRLIAIDPGYDDASVVSRLDTFFDRTPSIIEYNADSPAGMSYQRGQVELMQRLPVFERFASEYRLETLPADVMLRETLLQVWREFSARRQACYYTPTVAILDLDGAATGAEFALVQRDFTAHGIATLIATPEDLRYESGELLCGGRRVDLVYKRLLVADFLARYDLGHPLVRAYADGAVCVASSFRCTIAQKKRLLAALFDAAHARWFSREQRWAIRKWIAPTAAYARFDRSLLERRREDFVLKPNDAHGGEDVHLGWECDDQQWRNAVAAAAAGDFVVQRRVAAPSGLYPVFDADAPEKGVELIRLIEDRNAYVFRGELGGLLTRLSGSGLINVSRGGQAVPTFLIRPNETA
jgi:hypothetical protein